MTVAETIKELEKLPPYIEVYYDCPNCGRAHIFHLGERIALIRTKAKESK